MMNGKLQEFVCNVAAKGESAMVMSAAFNGTICRAG